MNGEHRADAALRALGELSVPDASPQGAARHRRQVIERLEQLQVEGTSRVPRSRWLGLGWASLAATVLGVAAVALWTLLPQPPVQVPAVLLAPNLPTLATGSEVKTDAGSSVHLRTALGAQIAVGGSSELRLAGSEQSGTVERVELALGSIEVKVPKLGPKRQFRVSTPDTLVIVHGTEFSVVVRSDARGHTTTVVKVTSGRVEVRKKQAVAFLDGGKTWSSEGNAASEGSAASEGNAVPREDSTVPVLGDKRTSVPPRPTPVRAEAAAKDQFGTASGSLARANALLTSALDAAHSGNDELALARLDELLRRYPTSPVADNARVERFRALGRLGRKREAARAAAGYLKGDPDGLARDEARALGE